MQFATPKPVISNVGNCSRTIEVLWFFIAIAVAVHMPSESPCVSEFRYAVNLLMVERN